MKSIFTNLLIFCVFFGGSYSFGQTTFTNTDTITTYSLGPGDPFPSTLTVSGLNNYTTKVVVTLHDVNITSIVCNQVYLQSPTGQIVCLFSKNGSAFYTSSGDFIFDQDSPNTPPYSYVSDFTPGTYHPNIANTQDLPATAVDRLDSFNTYDPNGTWSLFENGVIGVTEIGHIASWSLTITATNAPLPLSLTRFAVYQQDKTAQLIWETAAEKNTDQFRIERSIDGKNFTQTGYVKAAGNTDERTEYTYTDVYPAEGNNFYRLRMEDKDGTYSYSKVVVVHFSETAIQLYPNPCKDKLIIDGRHLKNATEITLVNIAGIKVLTQILVPEKGNQLLDVSQLRTGIYFVEAGGQNFRIQKR